MLEWSPPTGLRSRCTRRNWHWSPRHLVRSRSSSVLRSEERGSPPMSPSPELAGSLRSPAHTHRRVGPSSSRCSYWSRTPPTAPRESPAGSRRREPSWCCWPERCSEPARTVSRWSSHATRFGSRHTRVASRLRSHSPASVPRRPSRSSISSATRRSRCCCSRSSTPHGGFGASCGRSHRRSACWPSSRSTSRFRGPTAPTSAAWLASRSMRGWRAAADP